MKILDYSTGVWRITVDYGVECYIMLSEKKWPRWHHDDRGILFSKSGKKRERERKRNTFKKLHFSFFFVFFLLLINVSKIVALFIVVHFFEDIGNFIDFCFDALRSKDCFLLEFDYKCTVQEKRKFLYNFAKKKKKKYLRNFERLHQEENGA